LYYPAGDKAFVDVPRCYCAMLPFYSAIVFKIPGQARQLSQSEINAAIAVSLFEIW